MGVPASTLQPWKPHGGEPKGANNKACGNAKPKCCPAYGHFGQKQSQLPQAISQQKRLFLRIQLGPRNFPGGRVWSLARFMPYGAVVCCTVQPCGGFGPPFRIGLQPKPALFSSILFIVQDINLAPSYDPVRYAPAQIPESSEVVEHLHRNPAAQISHIVAQILGSPNALQGGGKPLGFKSPQRH